MTDEQYCNALIKKRDGGSGTKLFTWQTLRWKVILLVGAALYSYLAWNRVGDLRKYCAVVVASFVIGTLVRDLQWRWRLVQDWPRIVRFLDWPKIEGAAKNESENE